MAQLQKGTTYITGDQVTAANLNALVDSGILTPGAVTDQTAKTVPLAADTILLHSAADTALRKTTMTQLFATPQPLGATTPSSVAATTGTFSSTLGVTGVATLGNGAILGTPASGTVTNLTGTASININGTVGATTRSTGAFSSIGIGMNATYQLDLTVGGSDGIRLNASSGQCNIFLQQAGVTNGYINAAGGAGTDLNIYAARSLNLNGGISGISMIGNTAITGTLSSTTGANFATSSGSVGIGTTSPSTYVSDGGLALLGLYGTSSAAISIYNNSSASATNIAKIDFRLNNTFSGTGPCAAIYGLNPNAAANNGGALVFSTSANGTSTTPTERMRIDSSGNVGIGTASPEKTLHVVGNGKFTSDLSCDLRIFMRNPGVYDWALRTNTSSNSFEIVDWNTTLTRIAISTAGAVRFNAYGAGSLTTDGSGNITAVSDERIKSNIRPFSRGLSDIIAINPILHGYTEGSGLDQSRDDYAGFSAQQVQPLIPEAIGVNADGMLSFSDRPIIAALVNAVKELSARLAALESK